MHQENIKLLVRKQLKKQNPNWNRMNRKVENVITREVLEDVAAEYDFVSRQ